jgi:hypothetical protein
MADIRSTTPGAKGSAYPLQPNATYLGEVKVVYPDNTVGVYVKKLSSTFSHCKVVGSPLLKPIVKGDRVVCGLLDGLKQEMVVYGSYDTTGDTPIGVLDSLTVTGDVTVDTSTLKVDSTNNRVGVGTASPAYSLDVRGEMRSLFYGEKWTITGTAANTAVTITTTTSCNVYTNLDSTANWGLQIQASGYLIDNRLAIGDTFTVTHASNQGATGYYMNNGISIDASSPIPNSSIRWQGGTAPTTGNTNTTDVYVFTCLKTGSFSWEIFGSLTKFGA